MYESGTSEIQWVREKLEEYDVLNNKHDKGYLQISVVCQKSVHAAAEELCEAGLGGKD